MDTDTILAEKLTAILPHLNRKQRRLLLVAEARSLGRAARLSGVSRPTIAKATRQLEGLGAPSVRVRRVGAGRRKLRDRDLALTAELEALVETDGRGDPMSRLRWT